MPSSDSWTKTMVDSCRYHDSRDWDSYVVDVQHKRRQRQQQHQPKEHAIDRNVSIAVPATSTTYTTVLQLQASHTSRKKTTATSQRPRRRPHSVLSSIPSSSVWLLQAIVLAVVLVLGLFPQTTMAAIYFNNHTYASLPGLFGHAMSEGKTYQARLQFLRQSPFLCDNYYMDNSNNGTGNSATNTTSNTEPSYRPLSSAFVKPKGPMIGNVNHTGGSEEVFEPVVLLASRGHCPFQQKASVAESIDPTVIFLIVYNYHVEDSNEHSGSDNTNNKNGGDGGYYDQDDVMVPMFSEMGNTRLVLLSVSYNTGQELKRLIRDSSEQETNDGGPIIFFDSIPPDGIISAEELRDMMLSALGLFFMLISMSGCMMIVLGTYYTNNNHENGGGGGHFVLEGGRIMFIDAGSSNTNSADTNEDGGTIDNLRQLHSSRNPTGRRLLTESQVQKLARYTRDEVHSPLGAAIDSGNAEDDGVNHANSTGNTTRASPHVASAAAASVMEEDSCAICIDDFQDEHDNDGENYFTITLPCHHKFHTDCIVPWLTERQCKCPLCKFDVLDYLIEKEEEQEQQQNETTGGLTVDTGNTGPDDVGFNQRRNRSPSSWLVGIVRRGYRFTRVLQQDQDQRSASGIRDGIVIAPEEMEMTSTSSTSASLHADSVEDASADELELAEQRHIS